MLKSISKISFSEITRLLRHRSLGMVLSKAIEIDTKNALNEALPSIKNEVYSMLAQVCNRHDMPVGIANRVSDYYRHCFEYNLIGGKLARARTVCETLRFCTDGQVTVDSEHFKAALVLGWTVEILQAFFLIEDDVMDRGITRRGRPCWYRGASVGVANAINDGLLLEQVLYELIEMNESTKSIAFAASRILREAAMRTVIGQHLDTLPPASILDFNREHWLAMVRFKTAFYTYWLPCQLGILVSGKPYSENDLKSLKNACLLLGELFQAQDDMHDCFGEPGVIGKVGRDIEEGKCTWLLYRALELADDATRTELVGLFTSEKRSEDPTISLQVKAVYSRLHLKEKYLEYFDLMSRDIDSEINTISASELKRLANWLFHSTCRK